MTPPPSAPPPPPPRRKKAAGKPSRPAPKSPLRREFSAGFLLYRDTPEGRRWLLLDYGRHWDYPKGHLEKGESPWRAAVRELREETGIRRVNRVGRFQKAMHYFFFSPKKGRVYKTVTYFVGRTDTPDIQLSDEHSGYAWLDYDSALRQLTFENARILLRAAEAAVRQAAVS